MQSPSARATSSVAGWLAIRDPCSLAQAPVTAGNCAGVVMGIVLLLLAVLQSPKSTCDAPGLHRFRGLLRATARVRKPAEACCVVRGNEACENSLPWSVQRGVRSTRAHAPAPEPFPRRSTPLAPRPMRTARTPHAEPSWRAGP